MSVRDEILRKELSVLEDQRKDIDAKIAAVKLLLGPQQDSTPFMSRYLASISFPNNLGQETEKWIRNQAGNFTISDLIQYFKNSLEGKNLNEQAVRNAFKKVVSDNPSIELVHQGEGRRPSIYRNK